MKDYKNLQNGSDIRGVALAGVSGEPVNLTPQAVTDLAAAFVLWIQRKTGNAAKELEISVGSDSRFSGPKLREAAMTGILSTGASCADCGMASTPAMFMSTIFPDAKFSGAIMITASHLPWNRNGMKFFLNSGGLEKDDISEIIAIAEEDREVEPRGKRRSYDIITPYSTHLASIIRDGIGDGETPLRGYKIAVDAGNGAAGFFATDVLAPLGADISASQFLEPDGEFPNHAPNPEANEVMEIAKRMVLDSGANLGLVFDTDVDRAAAVDGDGAIFSRNRLIGLLATIVAKKNPGCTIVTDSVTSDHLTSFIEKLGLVHHRFRRGYRNVIREGIRLNEEGRACPLAIETSGHCAFAENYFLDDGAYLSAMIVIEMVRAAKEGKKLSGLIAELRDPAEAVEVRIRILASDFKHAGTEVLEKFAAFADAKEGWNVAPVNYEGIRVSVPAAVGWTLLRLSLHDPLLALNIESDRVGGVKEIMDDLRLFLNGFDTLEKI